MDRAVGIDLWTTNSGDDLIGEAVHRPQTTEAVITVPAYFNDAQHQATPDAYERKEQ
jgi:molecular chaperone DnaK (HSP70)